MKVIKITAVWCSGCIVMNKVWNEVLERKEYRNNNLRL